MNEIPQYVYDLIGICLFVGMWVGGVLLIWFIFSNGERRRIARQLAQLMLQDGPNRYLTCLRSDYPRNASSEAESWDNEYIPYTPGYPNENYCVYCP